MLKSSEFNKFNEYMREYLPDFGEGENKATQTVVAISKLVYKFYNDGDTLNGSNCYLSNYGNDMSSYGNWLYYNTTPEIKKMLLANIEDEDEYSELLYAICEEITPDLLLEYSSMEKIDSVYDKTGPFFENIDEYFDRDEYFDD